MKERILEFLKKENKSSAQFADEIGVQPSGISHILSGRNNPSLDFVIKMLEKYPFLSTEWLLFGKGSIYKDKAMGTLFDDINQFESESVIKPVKNQDDKPYVSVKRPADDEYPVNEQKRIKGSEVLKIVWFYEDNSFKEYTPRKD